jgi:oligopeptide/dipeptide ABC transporter ATP-binding protein
LIASVPVLGEIKEELDTIPGNVPNLVNLPPGCRFASRCLAREKYGLQACDQVEPDLINVGDQHQVRCWLYQEYQGQPAPLRKPSQDAR